MAEERASRRSLAGAPSGHAGGAGVGTPGRMDVYSFGSRLLETNDLDPVYVVLWWGGQGSYGMSRLNLRKWLLAYFCFYHCGVASWVADGGPDYWDRLETATSSSSYPRGTERRHWRGDKAVEAVCWLRHQGLDSLFRPLVGRQPFARVRDVVCSWPQFGPWMAFKAADMLDRLGLMNIVFDEDDVFSMYDSPRQGLEMLTLAETGRSDRDAQAEVYSKLERFFGHYSAPPAGDRPVNVQEIETVLCKWKSHVGGHYSVGKDTHEVREHLMTFPTVRTSQLLLRAGRRGGLWGAGGS